MRQLVACCEHGNGQSGFTKYRKFQEGLCCKELVSQSVNHLLSWKMFFDFKLKFAHKGLHRHYLVVAKKKCHHIRRLL
jgi:hypothetical protein